MRTAQFIAGILLFFSFSFAGKAQGLLNTINEVKKDVVNDNGQDTTKKETKPADKQIQNNMSVNENGSGPTGPKKKKGGLKKLINDTKGAANGTGTSTEKSGLVAPADDSGGSSRSVNENGSGTSGTKRSVNENGSGTSRSVNENGSNPK